MLAHQVEEHGLRASEPGEVEIFLAVHAINKSKASATNLGPAYKLAYVLASPQLHR